MQFTFGEFKTRVIISREIPYIEKTAQDLGYAQTDPFRPLVICDENTCAVADKICGSFNTPRCTLESGEDNKNWLSVQKILAAAHEAGLGRDSVFIGAGGGVITDMAGFASSIYMRGCKLVLVSTTLLGMADASVGGKTGFDLFGIKNLAGSFYPAEIVYMPLDCLRSLPEREWKSGMAELVKTAVLDGDDFLEELAEISAASFSEPSRLLEGDTLRKCIERAVMYKGGIVSEDLRESGRRMLLNLGHTFGHALETAAGLGNISHGEAVAWGIVRSCELGYALGITPRARAEKIEALIKTFGYNCACPHPLSGGSTDAILNAMNSDKKKKKGRLAFIVPDGKSARIALLESESEIKTVEKIIKGEFIL
jgi:3-dehydroquinate synthase